MSVPLDPPITLEQYAAILADGTGDPAADWPALAARHGVAASAWTAGAAAWTERLRDPVEARRFRDVLRDALARTLPDAAPVSFDDYVAINAAVAAGVPPENVFAEHQVDARRYSLASYQWMDRLERDARLEVYFRLRVQHALARRRGRAAREPFAVYGPGNLVRGRRCHACGALKAVVPRNALIYCDYCATLFDHDATIAIADAAALDPDMVDRALWKAVDREARAALAAGDRAAWARLAEWTFEVEAELVPRAHSPRLRDPDYRRRLVHDVIVPWTFATHDDPAHRNLSRAIDETRAAVLREPTLEAVLGLLGLMREMFELERRVLEDAQVFARHPDGLTGDAYLRINASVFVRPWLAALSDHDQQELLRAAGVACDWIAAPTIDFAACGCGHCGAALQVPAGARRMLCEGCGFVLDVGDRRFDCRQCGAPLSLPAGATDVPCGACGARWVRP